MSSGVRFALGEEQEARAAARELAPQSSLTPSKPQLCCAVCSKAQVAGSSNRGLPFDYCTGCKQVRDFVSLNAAAAAVPEEEKD
jgi:hypothetical protein